MKKQTKAQKLAHKIYLKIHPRIEELVMKFVKGNFNDATMYTFQIGMESTIEDELKGKMK